MIFHVQLVPFHRFTFISPSWFQMTGHTPEELETDHELLRKIVHPDDINIFNNIKSTCEDITRPIILRLMHKDGTIIWTEQTRTVIRNKTGEPQALYIVVRDITEKKWAEDALKESEEFTSTLLANTPNPIFVAYPDSAIKYVNPAFEKLSGYTLSDIIGTKTPYPWWPEETRDEIDVYLKETHFTKGMKKEMAYRKKNGERFWVEVSATVINNGGERQYHLINWVDITERKQMEEALRFSDAAFKSIHESIIAVDNNRTITYWNNSSEQLFGIPAAKSIGQQLHDVLKPVPGDPEQDQLRIKQLVSQGYYRNERLYAMPHGDIWVDTSVQVMKKGDTKFGYVITSLDITERKQMETALRESEEKFSKAFNASANAISIRSLKNHLDININDAFTRFTGYTREEIIAGGLDVWVNPEEKQRWSDAIEKEGRALNHEFSSRMKSGEIRFGLASSDMINIGGEPYRMMVITDITQRKQAEKALQESEEKFSKAFNSASDAMALISSNGGSFLEVNDNYVKLSGYSRQELIGHNADELNMWASQEDRNRILKLSLEKGRFNNEEIKFRNKSGQVSICLFSAESINLGGVRRMIIVVEDITERKKMEMALRESEEKFFKAFNTSANAVAITSAEEKKFVEVNESFCRFTGYSREEIIGHCAEEFNLWVYKEELQKSIELLKRDGRIFNMEFSYRMKSGEIRIGLSSVEIINIGGTPCRLRVITDITERKQMEVALRESEEKFSKAFLASANSICITTLEDNRLIEVNESYSRFTGYTREEVLGRTAAELNLWTNKEDLRQFHDKIENEGGFHNLEMRSRAKSGEVKVGLASAEILNINGKQCRIVAITDITERKKAEEALRVSEEKFSKAFREIPCAIGITTIKDGRFIDVNDSFYQVMGYTRQEAIGRTSTELNIWVEDESREKLVGELSTESHPRNKMIKFRKKSGEVGVGLFSVEKIVVNNEPCMISVNMEVTQQIKAEESLKLLGYSIDEVLGADIDIFSSEPITKKTRKEITSTLALGKIWKAVLTKRRKDGSTFLCDCRRSPLFDENGRPSSYIVVYRDITEQKETEAKIQAQNLMVESILTSMPEGVLVTDSADRIIMANESFRKIFHTGRKVIENKAINEVLRVGQLFDHYTSVKMENTDVRSLEFRYKVKNAEKIIACVVIKMDIERMLLIFTDVSREREEEDKLYLMDRLASLGEMAAGLAHELNNPLTGILTLSQLLVNSDLPDQHKEDMQCVYDEAKRAASIVKNVLLFTRNNSYENGQSSVNDVVREVLRLREHEERMKNINIITNLQENMPEIQLDKYQLQQVFLNIILNAEAAIEETNRPGTLTVTSEKVNNHVNIIFADTGCGIKKNVLSRIFDPFFTTKDIGKGTGLGLSICYGIIVKHNGKISVKTQVGKGTTFTIRMPIAAN